MRASKNKTTTDVIFRKDRVGNILAVFPGKPGLRNYELMYYPRDFASFISINPCGYCTLAYYHKMTKPALPDEYNTFKEELEKIGYIFRVVKRITQKHILEKAPRYNQTL